MKFKIAFRHTKRRISYAVVFQTVPKFDNLCICADFRLGCDFSEETQISICVDDGHKTAKNVVKAGAFTVSIADAENIVACDYVGIASGNEEADKIGKTGWHVTKSDFVNAPLFDELPMALECKLISYDEENCRLVGEIVNVCVDERILDKKGMIDLNKFSPITLDPVNHTYRRIGEVVGKAFGDGLKLK